MRVFSTEAYSITTHRKSNPDLTLLKGGVTCIWVLLEGVPTKNSFVSVAKCYSG